jgi:hypothetical protein
VSKLETSGSKALLSPEGKRAHFGQEPLRIAARGKKEDH